MSQPAIPPASMEGLVRFITVQALSMLGLIPEVASQPGFKPQLPLAKHLIDSLEILRQKTTGNLTAEESTILSTTLSQLQLAYVQAQQTEKR